MEQHVVVVTGGKATLSKNESGGQHLKVVLDHKDAEGPSHKYTLAAPYSFEVNGAVLSYYGPSGTILEFLALPEFRRRFPHLVTDHLMGSGFCALMQNPNGTFYCAQSTCAGSCKLHNWPSRCSCD